MEEIDPYNVDTDVEDDPANNSDAKPSSSSKKPLCKYGSKCYRKNPSHVEDFHHPCEYSTLLINQHARVLKLYVNTKESAF